MVSYRCALKVLFVFAVVLWCGSRGNVYADDGAVNLTLDQAVRMAVEKNLDVKAELYNPAGAEADIRISRGIYDPLLNLLLSYRESNTLPASVFLAGAQVNRQRVLTYNAGISQLIPSGAVVELAFDNTWNRNNADPTRGFLTNYYQSDLVLNLTQPLLRNFGREVTEINIEVAKYAKEGTIEQFKTRLMDTVVQVRDQYFQLFSLREDLEVRKTSLALAERILSDTRAQVRAGVLPAMEILNAEFGVATRQKDLIDAERAVRDQIDRLRVLLQYREAGEIVPVDVPFRERYEVDEAAAIRRALTQRPELRELQTALITNELLSRVARNQTLPDLSLNVNGAVTGLATEYRRDLERLGSGRYPVWGAGVQFSYPLGNNAAENELIKSRLRVEQTRTRIRSLEDNVANEVRIASRGVAATFKQLDVTERGRVYAEERLQAFIKRNRVGLATTRDVLDVETELVTAKGNHIRAIADYNNAITTLWRASGELLEKEGIVLSGMEAESLYEKNREP